MLPTTAQPMDDLVPNPLEQESDESQLVQEYELDSILSLTNVAEELDDTVLNKIGHEAIEGYNIDSDSRTEWLNLNKDWMELALQVVSDKTYPWVGASNIKYPILSTAALQFHARSYPALVPPGNSLVKAEIFGPDPQGKLASIGNRIGAHMSYQLLHEMPSWDEDMDKLLLTIPISGNMFKKTYYCPVTQKNVSEPVYPRDLVVNYWTKNLASASRVTHVLYMTHNELQENIRAGIFLDIPDMDKLEAPNVDTDGENYVTNNGVVANSSDTTTPFVILEQHTWLDLDGDGYKEPWIVTLHKDTAKVLRIVPRFDNQSIKYSADKKTILRIEPVEYFTKYSFIPNPDGGFYDYGFGLLLGPLNESINTIINQLVDAGTLSNLQSGFIGRGIKIRGGDFSFKPGEWKFVNSTGADLKQNIFPMPVREPSSVLFQLLGSLIESGMKLASIAEIFVGKMPGQNTPATTTMHTIDEGMKLFTAIYKRLYRSFDAELKKLYRLNKIYGPDQVEYPVQVSKQEYQQAGIYITPTADANAISDGQRISKAEALLQLLPLHTINAQEVTKRVLEARREPDIEALLQVAPPPPDPKLQAVQAKAQLDAQKFKLDAAKSQQDMQIAQQKAMLDLVVSSQKAQTQLQLQERKINADMIAQHSLTQGKSLQDLLKLKTSAETHQQNLRQKEEQHQQDLKMAGGAHVSGDKQGDISSGELKPANVSKRSYKNSKPKTKEI